MTPSIKTSPSPQYKRSDVFRAVSTIDGLNLSAKQDIEHNAFLYHINITLQ
ncbi:MAG: hypothetical protein JWP81_1152 [Ferruginibacter sp.]|nr:hypothetical protein [Ferruginibacter sp.]